MSLPLTGQPVPGYNAASESLFRMARWSYDTMPKKLDAWKQATHSAADASQATRIANRLKRGPLWLLDKMVRIDYSEYVKLGKLKFAQLPLGFVMTTFFLGTMVPRSYQAIKRSKDHDFSEVGDIVRRDLVAVTCLIFLLDIVKKYVNKLKQPADGIRNLFHPLQGEEQVLTYSQRARVFRMDSPEAIYEMARQGNTGGMSRAVDKALKSWRKQIGDQFPEVQGHLDAVEQQLKNLVGAVKTGAAGDSDTAARKAAEALFEHIRVLDTFRTAQMDNTVFGRKAVDKLSRMLPELGNVVVNYAKSRKLPGDIFGYLFTVGFVGFLPVWFNNYWNRRKFERKASEGVFPIQPPANTQPPKAPVPSAPSVTGGLSPVGLPGLQPPQSPPVEQNARQVYAALRQSSRPYMAQQQVR
ncbi:MAG: hypothetical protein AB7P76_01180 [Candidatus Melainabacteria bacterium]